MKNSSYTYMSVPGFIVHALVCGKRGYGFTDLYSYVNLALHDKPGMLLVALCVQAQETLGYAKSYQ